VAICILRGVLLLLVGRGLRPADFDRLLNRVPASAGVKAGMSPLPGGR